MIARHEQAFHQIAEPNSAWTNQLLAYILRLEVTSTRPVFLCASHLAPSRQRHAPLACVMGSRHVRPDQVQGRPRSSLRLWGRGAVTT
jgi:hypothetical protein